MTEEAGSPQHGSGDGGEALLPPAAHSLPLAVPDGDGAAAACVPAAADPGEQPPNGEGGGAEAQKGDRGGGGGSSDETQLDEASAAAADEMDGHGTRTQSRPAKRGRSSLARGSAAGRGRRPKALDDHIDAGSDAQQAANGRGRRSTAAVESPSRSQQTARRRRAPSSSAQPRDLDGEPEEDKMDCDDPEAATDHKATPSKRKRGPRSRPAPARERNPARKRRSVGSGDGPHEADPAGQIPDSLGGASGEEAGTMKSPKRGNAPGSSRRNNLPAALRPETLFKSASSLLVVHKEEASQLLSKAVWDTFTPDEQRELLALLPSVDTVSQANPDAPRAIRDGLLRKDYHLCDSFNRMIEDLAEGLYTDREQRLMLQNFEKTVHKFDEWKARNYEAVWGDQLDISRWRRLAGAASEISFAELCLNARVFVGDTLHIKKTFKKLGMSLDLFAEITHISKQGVATLRCGQTTWTSDTLTQIENKFIDIGIPNLPKSERPNGNAWKSITLLRSGKKVGSMFDVRADYSSGTRQGELAGGAHGQSTDTPDTAVASTPQHADSGAATEALVPSFVPHNCRDVEVGDPLEGSPWVAIEANPGVFTELAQRIGIRGVEVQEVFTLDPDELKAMQPIHGLIFLFQWGDTDSKQSEIAAQDGQIPENVFFINQARRASAVVQNACATQALISIALNCHSLDLDDSLKAFKEFSAEMTPAMRGLALSSCQWLRTAHNSFARQTDMPVLHYPMPTKKVEEPRRKKSKPSESDDSDESSDDDAGNASDFEKSTKSSRKRRPKNASKARKGKRAKEENDEAEDEGHDGFGFHFIGYLPIDGVVWELDGLKRAPRDLGPVPANGDWVRVVVKTLEEKMASDSLEFNLLALVTDRRQLIAQQLKQLQGSIAYLDGLADPENYKYSMLLETLGDHANLLEGLEHNATLSAAREALEAHIKTLGQRLREEDEKRDEYAAENVRRRFNYAPFLRKWFETMASKHQLDRLLD